jgi:formylglycine-generating enzyme required for sulfatase activity
MCHGSAGGVNLTTRAAAVKKGLVPGKPEASTVYTTVKAGKMPPGEKLAAAQQDLLAKWIAAGALWPETVTLGRPVARKVDERETVRKIREKILANRAASSGKYTLTIPNTLIAYDMVSIPAGKFDRQGSPIQVDAFWMQAHEVTWDEYRLFMFANQAGETTNRDERVDAITRPTRPYVEMSFGMGINGFPAISMTQHAANKYAEWLSAKTGEFYRLPTEAEWEYACRAGGTPQTPITDYAWFGDNSNGKYQKVATKKPNGFGLYDMLGNVMEWTLDQMEPYPTGPQTNPWVKSKAPYPHAVRGGSWNDPADAVNCTERVGSDASWKQQDPQLPKSIWYMTDAQWLGFRLVRPAKVPSAEEMFQAWNNGVEHDEQ